MSLRQMRSRAAAWGQLLLKGHESPPLGYLHEKMND
jgi:hypothetical protein